VVAEEDLAPFYAFAMILSGVLGLVAGVVGRWLAGRLILGFGEKESRFLERVVKIGLISCGAALALGIAVTAALAVRSSMWQLAEMQRLSLVLRSGRILAVAGAAWMGAGAAFLTGVSFFMRGTARRALLNR